MVSSHAVPHPRNRQMMSAPSVRESERPLVDGSRQLPPTAYTCARTIICLRGFEARDSIPTGAAFGEMLWRRQAVSRMTRRPAQSRIGQLARVQIGRQYPSSRVDISRGAAVRQAASATDGYNRQVLCISLAPLGDGLDRLVRRCYSAFERRRPPILPQICNRAIAPGHHRFS
jgi:hypothetical protein